MQIILNGHQSLPGLGEHVDAGWGRRAPGFAYLFENLHWREYIHLLAQTGVEPGTRLSRYRLWEWFVLWLCPVIFPLALWVEAGAGTP
jgi:hypothetical protein